MESLRRRLHRRRWGRHATGCSAGEEWIGQALDFPAGPATEDDITQLLGKVESALARKDGEVLMCDDAKSYASYLEKHLDKVTAGVNVATDVFKALGALPWVGAGLTLVAMGLDLSLKMQDNKEQCRYLMKQYLNIWKRFMRPILENEGPANTDIMVESMDLIIEGYLFCKKLSNTGGVKRFLLASYYNQEMETLKKKLEFFLLKEIGVNTIPLRRPGCPTAISSTLPTKAVALKDRTRDVMRLVKVEAREETRIVVLHGMGGVGKSLLGKTVYDQICTDSKEMRRCRIELGEKPSKEHITNLQRQMVESLTGRSLMMERDAETVKDKLRKVLLNDAGGPVLIYIDNVLQQKDLEECISLDCELIALPKGSRWLVTTRDESVCTRIFERNRGFQVEQFKVKPLKDKDALKLFCLHAFGVEEPSSEEMDEYEYDGQDLIGKMVTSICGNLPLALRVLGRSLYGTDVHEWRKKYDRLKNFGELQLDEQIANVLKSSYDALDGETQTAFLMACVCFINSRYYLFREVVESTLPRAAISRLLELGLVELETSPSSVLDGGLSVFVRMHDLVRSLGYQMAVARKCAPTIMPTCKQDLLNVGEEIWSDIKWLRVPALEDGVDAEFIEKCRELQMIILHTHVNGHITNPPLRLNVVINSTSTPSAMTREFNKLKELVYVGSRSGVIEEFSAVAPSAERLQVFDGFVGRNIPDEAVDLHKNTLRILRCVETAELSSYFCQRMTKLRELELVGFEGESLPEEMGSLTNLEELCITSTTIEELPQSLGRLGRLRVFSLQVKELNEFPSGVLVGMKELKWLQLHLQGVTSMPLQELGQLPSLEVVELRLPSIDRLGEEYGLSLKLRKLKFLNVDCASMSSLEGVRLSCPSLECLHLGLGEVEELPAGFITGCTKLRALFLFSCRSLRELSADMEMLSHVESWALWDCPSLRTIPEGVMKTVQSLVVWKCPEVQGMPRDVDEKKARSMRFLACDAQILPPCCLALPGVLAYDRSGGYDWRAREEIDSFVREFLFPAALLNA